MSAEREMAERLAAQGETHMRRRQAVIDVVNTDGTVDVVLGDSGVVVPGMSYKATYRPRVGDVVFVEVFGSDMVVDGGLAQAGGTAGILNVAGATADQSGITTEVDVTGANAQVRVAANRAIRIWASIHMGTTVAGDVARLRIAEGSTVLKTVQRRFSGANVTEEFNGAIVLRGGTAPSPGLHTYKMVVLRQAGTGTISTSTSGSFASEIVVEDLGPW